MTNTDLADLRIDRIIRHWADAMDPEGDDADEYFCDHVTTWLEARPCGRDYTPSEIAKGTGLDLDVVHRVLVWAMANYYVVPSGRGGSWTRYSRPMGVSARSKIATLRAYIAREIAAGRA